MSTTNSGTATATATAGVSDAVSATTPAAATAHILVIPYPAQGHLLSLLDLTHHLLRRGGVIATIVITPKNLPTLTPLLSSHPRTSLRTLILPFPPHPTLPPSVEHIHHIGNSGNTHLVSALSNLEPDIINWFGSEPDPPKLILSDFFLGWTQNLAQRLDIPRVGFFSSGLFLSCIVSYLFKNLDDFRTVGEIVEFTDLPRSPAFVEGHLPSIFRNFWDGDQDWRVVKEGMVANLKSWGCVFNSFSALEGEYLEYMKTLVDHNRVYGVGPLSLMGGSRNLSRVNPDSVTRVEVLDWLNGCPDGSVLYVCFGSQKLLSNAQMEALGLGLERSATRFVWVVKDPMAGHMADGYGLIPVGFEDRVRGRGFISRGWAPQVEILSHRAVAAFVSHCGWNSVLESIVAGVMILGWPMEADQFVNARLLVEYEAVAVRLCEGTDAVPVPDELARVIAESMSGCLSQKEKAKELREKALQAVMVGGSSCRDLDELVKDLKQLGEKN